MALVVSCIGCGRLVLGETDEMRAVFVACVRRAILFFTAMEVVFGELFDETFCDVISLLKVLTRVVVFVKAEDPPQVLQYNVGSTEKKGGFLQ